MGGPAERGGWAKGFYAEVARAAVGGFGRVGAFRWMGNHFPR